jgi:hypothetical protein
MSLSSRVLSVIAALAVAGTLLAAGGAGHAAAPGARSASASMSSASAARPRLVIYETRRSPGVFVHRPAQVRRLHGAPAGFKRFVGRTAARLDRRSDCDAATGVTVSRLRTDGYAVGAINECGGYAALWGKVDHRWRQLQGTQDSWDCGVLRRHRVPSAVVGTTCFSYHGDHRQHRYHQA